jgi:serine/threonine protein kinase
MVERNLLLKIERHPFIVRIEDAFQTQHYLHLVLEFCPGGELFFHLMKKRRFSESNARLIIAEIILALEHLHG